jgi:hypothetical protein
LRILNLLQSEPRQLKSSFGLEWYFRYKLENNSAQHLREMNNFNSLMAVIAGLNISAGFVLRVTVTDLWQVSRLKHTWDMVSKPSKEVQKD